MPTEFRQVRIDIPKGRSASGANPREFQTKVTFGAIVRNASPMIKSFNFDYVYSDHHINLIQVHPEVVAFNNREVTIRLRTFYADRNFDDLYQGFVELVVIAETIAPPASGPVLHEGP